MTNREKFIEIYTSCIKREGADKLLEFLTSDVITDSPDDYAEDIFDISQNIGTESGDDTSDDKFGANPVS